jgi:hypothetical protein
MNAQPKCRKNNRNVQFAKKVYSGKQKFPLYETVIEQKISFLRIERRLDEEL